MYDFEKPVKTHRRASVFSEIIPVYVPNSIYGEEGDEDQMEERGGKVYGKRSTERL
jgi:hypothetical protein